MKIRELALQTGLFLFLAIGISAAQAPIDPSLPDAPLSHKRELYLFSGYGTVKDPHTPVPPLSAQQKYKLALLETIDFSMFLRAGIVSGFDKAVGAGPDYGPGLGGFGKLYAYNVANIASGNFFAKALIPSLAHQDPRFFRKGTGTTKSRIWWAIRSQFVAFSDQGTSMPNYGNIIGLPMSTALSAAYLPAKNVSFGKTMKGIGIRFGVDAGLDTVREFGGFEQVGRLFHRHKKDGTGT